jgi:hypothetical protein
MVALRQGESCLVQRDLTGAKQGSLVVVRATLLTNETVLAQVAALTQEMVSTQETAIGFDLGLGLGT